MVLQHTSKVLNKWRRSTQAQNRRGILQVSKWKVTNKRGNAKQAPNIRRFFIALHHKWQTKEVIEHKAPNIKGVSQCSSWAVRNERRSSKQISAKYKSFLQCSTSVVPNKSGSSPQAANTKGLLQCSSLAVRNQRLSSTQGPNIIGFQHAAHRQCGMKDKGEHKRQI